MGCESVARFILLIFNIIFFLLGATALGVGIWVVIDAKVFLSVLGNIPADTNTYGRLIADAGYILIAGGAAVFLIAFLGCCGAWKKHKCLLMTYAVILGIILLLEVACVVVGYFFYDNVSSKVKETFTDALVKEYDSKFTGSGSSITYEPGNLFSKGVDAIQLEFSCCGVNNYSDYLSLNSTAVIPASCCAPPSSATLQTLVDQLYNGELSSLDMADASCFNNVTYLASVDGCYTAIENVVLSRSTLFMAIAGATAGIQLLLILFACCLFCAIRNEEKRP